MGFQREKCNSATSNNGKSSRVNRGGFNKVLSTLNGSATKK